MAIKKSELYTSLWASCDELRGSMDASQYKDYVLVLLFMKYVSDKGGDLVDIPEGGSFADMVKLKGQPDIGDRINKIIGELAKANGLTKVIDVADFNNEEKLGKGKEMVDRLSNLIEIFENEALDFTGNRAENDDLLGDAYEYLMRHFATESGKSKGQFYTPSEVSRIMAKVIGIENSKSQSETLYDPTCGSGSLLLKAADESPQGITIYGQEKDNATRALAVMNMWLHGNPESEIVQGNTLANPLFKETNGGLKRFDFIVANPPFSDKRWSTGIDPLNDEFERFDGLGIPPDKNGDYAYLLHLIKSLKSNGKAAIILPLGVLFRGNAEAEIRRNIINRGYIKGIIGLPPNLFYGTGIAASIIVIDKEGAEHRNGIFMIDASKGFMKDGNKNRFRSQDIHRIVDVFNKQLEIPKYSRMIPVAEISDPKNDYNLNIPRYIDTQEEEDIQDIDAHLNGGIPIRDINALEDYWQVFPTLKNHLFKPNREGYLDLKVDSEEIKFEIFNHPEFKTYVESMQEVFDRWKGKTSEYLKSLGEACHPKEVIHRISEDLLESYHGKPLVDKYKVYQHLMDYWAEEMQDDLYELSADGWKAGNEVSRKIKTTKSKGNIKKSEVAGIEGLEGRLIPPALIIQEYFSDEQAEIDELQSQLDSTVSEMEELQEEHSGEDGLLEEVIDEKGKITKKTLDSRLKELSSVEENKEELDLIKRFKKQLNQESKLKSQIKAALSELEVKVIKKYPELTESEIKELVVESDWMTKIHDKIQGELNTISYQLTERIQELSNRYKDDLPSLESALQEIQTKVNEHLKQMEYSW